MIKMYEHIKRISQWTAYISYAGICFALLFTITDISMRYFLNKPILGSYEITQMIFACTVFATYAHTQAEKGHINVVVLLRLFPQKLRFVIYTFTGILSVIACGAVSWAAFRHMNNLRISNLVTAQHRIPYYPFYGYAGVMMALFTVVLLFDAVQSGVAIFRKDYADMIESDWS